MTPLHLKIALHYHVSPDQWPDLDVPLHREYAGHLVNAGMLRDGIGLDGRGFARSDGLAVWIEAMLATPVPVQRWVMPDRNERQGVAA